MKWYVVVEGLRTENKIYRAWIAHAFPGAARADRIQDMEELRYFLVIGHGYPSYIRRIRTAVDDIRANLESFDHLFICVDSEDDMNAEEKRAEIAEVVHAAGCPVPHTVIAHECCIETWLLGNARFARRAPERATLRRYQAFYDVRTQDPEQMPPMEPGGSRVRFHLDYLKEMFQERNLRYTKNTPGHACHDSYLHALVDRVDTTEHLRSMAFMVERWRDLGGQL